MDIDSFDFDESEAEKAAARREAKLLEDEQPVNLEGADDCGGACTI